MRCKIQAIDEPLLMLVDENDRVTGTAGKMDAHAKALLHRAVSVFIHNTKADWLLQRRALDKYHSNGLWTNTCCSHPYPGETSIDAARRRLYEEMGMNCDMREVFSFIYKEQVDNDLTEHELDHVFIGLSDELPVPDHREVMDWRFVSFPDLDNEIRKNPENFTTWFRHIYYRVHECYMNLRDG
jgi:isopentenyl-diphosphate delta-isomerase